MDTRWKMMPINGSDPIKWHWIKLVLREESAGTFENYSDCLADAEKHGYHGVDTEVATNGDCLLVCEPLAKPDPVHDACTSSDCPQDRDRVLQHEHHRAFRWFRGWIPRRARGHGGE